MVAIDIGMEDWIPAHSDFFLYFKFWTLSFIGIMECWNSGSLEIPAFL